VLFSKFVFSPLRGESNSSHTQKAGPWNLLRVLFKISKKHPCPFYPQRIMYISRKYPYSLQGRLMGIPRERRGSSTVQFLKGKYDTKMEFLEG